jgi:hypothetical protein
LTIKNGLDVDYSNPSASVGLDVLATFISNSKMPGKTYPVDPEF